MKSSLLAGSVAAGFSLALCVPSFAADPPPNSTPNPPAAAAATAAASNPAAQCLNDLRTFHSQMGQDGYWLSGTGYGYGYPMMDGGMGAGYGLNVGRGSAAARPPGEYQTARPGAEIRTLISAAHILARDGLQQQCESVLNATRSFYGIYLASMRDRSAQRADLSGWQQQQIAIAQPVTAGGTAFRADQLLDMEVRSPQNDALGSVDDIVMDPQTGRIAYLVIARGGLFGIGQSYVPVPWDAFKATPAVTLLVLDTTKAVMEAAPLVSNDHFAARGRFEQESRTVDAYWNAHRSAGGNARSPG